MGKFLGSYESDELDRSDLNKCPDCGCFFASEACPLCGKICPEHMRAGNRKAVKPPKKKRGSSSGRVVFIEWYHQWWFIILAMLFVPLVGIILFATSPYKKSLKITLVVIAAAWMLLMPMLVGMLIPTVQRWMDKPISTNLSKEEYIAACEQVEPRQFYRQSSQYEGKFITMTLTVEKSFVGYNEETGTEDTYYVCRDDSDSAFFLLVRDCQSDGGTNLMAGDVIMIWGEGGNMSLVYDVDLYENTYHHPCLNAAYVEIVSEP